MIIGYSFVWYERPLSQEGGFFCGHGWMDWQIGSLARTAFAVLPLLFEFLTALFLELFALDGWKGEGQRQFDGLHRGLCGTIVGASTHLLHVYL